MSQYWRQGTAHVLYCSKHPMHEKYNLLFGNSAGEFVGGLYCEGLDNELQARKVVATLFHAAQEHGNSPDLLRKVNLIVGVPRNQPLGPVDQFRVPKHEVMDLIEQYVREIQTARR